jgi:hypothetical protein
MATEMTKSTPQHHMHVCHGVSNATEAGRRIVSLGPRHSTHGGNPSYDLVIVLDVSHLPELSLVLVGCG